MIQRSYRMQEDFEDKEDQKVTNKGNLYPMIDDVTPYTLTTQVIRALYYKHSKHIHPCCGVLD
jgi:hypothetical protein